MPSFGTLMFAERILIFDWIRFPSIDIATNKAQWIVRTDAIVKELPGFHFQENVDIRTVELFGRLFLKSISCLERVTTY